MKKEQLFTRRRALLAGAAAVGAVGTAGVFAWGDRGEPVGAAVPAAGAQARSLPLKPSAYRLQPLTGYGP
ncbi:polysaccharide deacetylase family protein, partial [Streptomyces sp. AK04-3B]|nr:polysaccharide deacetylase family protein [Streptomyces sp. AK04-3B]